MTGRPDKLLERAKDSPSADLLTVQGRPLVHDSGDFFSAALVNQEINYESGLVASADYYGSQSINQ
jgi:hypothetical protein